MLMIVTLNGSGDHADEPVSDKKRKAPAKGRGKAAKAESESDEEFDEESDEDPKPKGIPLLLEELLLTKASMLVSQVIFWLHCEEILIKAQGHKNFLPSTPPPFNTRPPKCG